MVSYDKNVYELYMYIYWQLRKENPSGPIAAPVKVKEHDEIKEEDVTTTLRRAINFYSTIQAHDGHWPAESAGPLFFLPPLVSSNPIYIQSFRAITELRPNQLIPLGVVFINWLIYFILIPILCMENLMSLNFRLVGFKMGIVIYINFIY